MSKWPKRKLIHILFYSLVQIPTFFYGVYRCSNRRDGLIEYPFITAEAIKSDTSVIYDEEGVEIGEITVQRNNDGLICSIKGVEFVKRYRIMYRKCGLVSRTTTVVSANNADEAKDKIKYQFGKDVDIEIISCEEIK